MKAAFRINPHSLLLLMIAFVGNAQVMGVDVVLMLILVLFLMFFFRPWAVPRRSALLLLLLVFTLVLAIVRTVRLEIPYSETYTLWPIKAICLIVILAGMKKILWPMGNTLLLAAISLILILAGQIEGGRLVSIFGPNMLYRFFGFLLFFSAMFYFQNRGAGRIANIFFAIFGLFALLLTGSTGALLVIVTVCAVTIYRLSRVFSAIIAGAIAYLLVGSGFLSGALTASTESPAFYARLIYKITTLAANDRFLGWAEIFTRPFSLAGYSYTEFGGLWFYGYYYPHNIFIELYGFYGALGVMISILVLVAIGKSMPALLRGDVVSMTFIVITIGALLSGDMSDNYGVVGLAGGILLRSSLDAKNSFSRLDPRRRVDFENSYRISV